MHPWYNGFRGTIQEAPSKTAGRSYSVYGTIAQVRAQGYITLSRQRSSCQLEMQFPAHHHLLTEHSMEGQCLTADQYPSAPACFQTRLLLHA